MKKGLRISLLILTACFLTSWGLGAISLDRGFGRRDDVPDTELSYTQEMQTQYPRTEIMFLSGQNRLHGWVYAHAQDAEEKGLVVIVHGLGSAADAHLAETLFFVESGYDVLAFDGTGTRESEGRGVRGLSQASSDLDAALDYVRSDDVLKDLPLIVYGHSAGGYAAAVQSFNHPEVDGAVCICAFDKPLTEMMVMAKERAGLLSYAGYPGLALQYLILFGPDCNASAADAIRASHVPVLVVSGSEDHIVPYSVSLPAALKEQPDEDVTSITVTEEGRNGHVGLWFTKEANRARQSAGDVQGKVDTKSCNELCIPFMDKVVTQMDAMIHGGCLKK